MEPMYSAKSRGFYFKEIHGENIPSDAVSITENEYLSLLNKQVENFSIQPNINGQPVSIFEDSNQVSVDLANNEAQ